ERYRLGIASTFGDLRLATLVADYRRYVMPLKPFTIAMRVQHVGRYGRDAADPRLLPFVWYVQDTVRGFDGRQLPPAQCDARRGAPRVDAGRLAAGGELPARLLAIFAGREASCGAAGTSRGKRSRRPDLTIPASIRTLAASARNRHEPGKRFISVTLVGSTRP